MRKPLLTCILVPCFFVEACLSLTFLGFHPGSDIVNKTALNATSPFLPWPSLPWRKEIPKGTGDYLLFTKAAEMGSPHDQMHLQIALYHAYLKIGLNQGAADEQWEDAVDALSGRVYVLFVPGNRPITKKKASVAMQYFSKLCLERPVRQLRAQMMIGSQRVEGWLQITFVSPENENPTWIE